MLHQLHRTPLQVNQVMQKAFLGPALYIRHSGQGPLASCQLAIGN